MAVSFSEDVAVGRRFVSGRVSRERDTIVCDDFVLDQGVADNFNIHHFYFTSATQHGRPSHRRPAQPSSEEPLSGRGIPQTRFEWKIIYTYISGNDCEAMYKYRCDRRFVSRSGACLYTYLPFLQDAYFTCTFRSHLVGVDRRQGTPHDSPARTNYQ